MYRWLIPLLLITSPLLAADTDADATSDDDLVLRSQLNRLAVGNDMLQAERQELRRQLIAIESGLDNVVDRVLEGEPLTRKVAAERVLQPPETAQAKPVKNATTVAVAAPIAVAVVVAEGDSDELQFTSWPQLAIPLILLIVIAWIGHNYYIWGSLLPWRR